jgi:hypothetical protein
MLRPKLPAIDLSAHLAGLGADLGRRVPELAHIEPQRVLYAVARSRAGGTHGTYARIAPLRFAAGEAEITRRRGRFLETYRMPALAHQGRDILYLIQVLFPRFLRLTPEQKLNTVIHELYHISERCDGDIRRFPGRNFAHGGSRDAYNRKVAAMAAAYLASRPDPSVVDFLRIAEADWAQGRVRLTGLTVRLPRAQLVERKQVR